MPVGFDAERSRSRDERSCVLVAVVSTPRRMANAVAAFSLRVLVACHFSAKCCLSRYRRWRVAKHLRTCPASRLDATLLPNPGPVSAAIHQSARG